MHRQPALLCPNPVPGPCFSRQPPRRGQNWIDEGVETGPEEACPSLALPHCMTLRHIPSLGLSFPNSGMKQRFCFQQELRLYGQAHPVGQHQLVFDE